MKKHRIKNDVTIILDGTKQPQGWFRNVTNQNFSTQPNSPSRLAPPIALLQTNLQPPPAGLPSRNRAVVNLARTLQQSTPKRASVQHSTLS